MTEPRWLSPQEQQTWRAFLAACRLLFDALDRELQHDAGMPLAYYEILVRLSEAPDRTLRMSELANATQSSRSRLSHAVARLEEAGWVARRGCPNDGRWQLATLTDHGLETLSAAAVGHVASVRRHLFDQLSPGQLDQLKEVSQALLAHLSPGVDPLLAGDGACPVGEPAGPGSRPPAAQRSANLR